jgi:hypothetical protein
MYVTPSFLSIFSATQIQLAPPSKNYCHLGGQKEIISVGTGEKTFSIQKQKKSHPLLTFHVVRWNGGSQKMSTISALVELSQRDLTFGFFLKDGVSSCELNNVSL